MHTQTQTVQERIQALLIKTGIPYKEIRVYGAQIVVTSWSKDAAERWVCTVGQFAKIRKGLGCVESVDYAKDQEHRKTVNPAVIKVYRTYATLDK